MPPHQVVKLITHIIEKGSWTLQLSVGLGILVFDGMTLTLQSTPIPPVTVPVFGLNWCLRPITNSVKYMKDVTCGTLHSTPFASPIKYLPVLPCLCKCTSSWPYNTSLTSSQIVYCYWKLCLRLASLRFQVYAIQLTIFQHGLFLPALIKSQVQRWRKKMWSLLLAPYLNYSQIGSLKNFCYFSYLNFGRTCFVMIWIN